MNKYKLSLNFVLLVTSMFCLLACSQTNLGSIVIKEESNLSEFTKVNMSSLGKLILKNGQANSIRIETHDEIINNITYEVVNQELVIDLKGNRRNLRIEKLIITVTNSVYNQIELNDVADIIVEDVINTDKLEITQGDVGNITLEEVNTEELILRLEDVGKIQINKGTTKNGFVYQDGVGNIKTFGVLYQSCKAELNDVGNIEVSVENTLDANARGVGNIYYKGNPKVSKKESGTGKVIKK